MKIFLGLLLSLLAGAALPQSQVLTPFNQFLTGLPAAATPSGTERIPALQSGSTTGMTPAQLNTYVCAQNPSACTKTNIALSSFANVDCTATTSSLSAVRTAFTAVA